MRQLAAFFLLHLGLDGHGGVGHNHEAFLGNEFACDTADTVGLVLNADKGGIEVFDEFLLSGSETGVLFFL